MVKISRDKLINSIKEKYLNSSKQEKKIILDEICKIYGYNRKYVIRAVNTRRDEKEFKKQGKLLTHLSLYLSFSIVGTTIDLAHFDNID